jgi:dolichol kinase
LIVVVLFPLYAFNIEITGNKEVANNVWKVFSMLASLISEQKEKLGSYRVISWIFSMYQQTAS